MNNGRIIKPNKAFGTLATAASLLVIAGCGSDTPETGVAAGAGSPAVQVTGGAGGTNSAGAGGLATTAGAGGMKTTATAGTGGTSTTGAAGAAPTAGAGGTLTAGAGGATATAGSGGSATAGSGGSATAGSGGTTAMAGAANTAGAGPGQAGAPGMPVNPDDIPEPPSKLIGWAGTSDCGIDGVSGGGDQELVQVAGDELQDAIMDDAPRVILFSGETTGPVTLEGNNKTIIGIDGGHITGGLSISGGKKNTIIRNMKFSCDGGTCDSIEVSGASCIWFDHIEAFDGGDGNMDIVRGSDLITVSWSKFYYDKRNHGHRFSNLNGNKAGDTPGKIRVTFHHNWWGDKVLQRMPRVRHGRVHVFNNYYSTEVAQYFVGLSDSAKLVVENNFAEHPPSEHPVKFFNTSGTEIYLKGNVFTGVGNGEDRATGGMPWDPKSEYDYELESPEYARAAVMKYAGVK